MLKRIALTALACWPLAVLGAGGGGDAAYWEEPSVNLGNERSLQRGAQLFANNCMGCHSAQYHRWMHVSEDLDIPVEAVEENLIWTTNADGEKNQAGTLMTIAMTPEYGDQAFGMAPPDLTLSAREHGPAWIYNYLRTFYLDDSTPTGTNNAVLEGASMPHVLWDLQGWQRPVHADDDDDGEIVGFETVVEGSMPPDEFDRAVNDLVNFMVYLGEPARMDRTAIGGWVLFFLLALLGLAVLLKKEYWKDVDH
ncbi:MAG: cytochrome c1 [Halofilum sp. (in: g-proteobacteria)]